MFKTATQITLYAGMAVTTLIALYSLRYLIDGAESVAALAETDEMLAYLSGQESSFWQDFSRSQKPLYHAHEFAVVGHIAAASIALLAGFLQLSPYIRRTYPMLHRGSGYLYAFTAILGLGLGGYISFALPMIGGTKTVISNVIGGMVGIGFVVMAFVCIWKQRFLEHGRWMVRSYAMLMAIVTVYLLVALFALLGVDPERGYGLAHMLCFPINMILAEIYIRRPAAAVFKMASV